MKRIISFICALLMLAMLMSVFSGCQSDDGDTKQTEEPGATKVKIWVRSFEDWADNLLQEQVNEFNSIMDDGIQIVLQFYGDDNTYDTAIAAGVENDTVADIFMAQYDRVYTYMKTGYIAPVGDFLTEEEKDGYIDSVREYVSFVDPSDQTEKMYAMPWYLEPSMMLYYNKDILQQAGVTVAPETAAELLEACAKIKPLMQSSRNEYVLAIPTTSVELTWTTEGLLENFTGGQAVDNTTWTINRVKQQPEDFAQVAKLWYDLSKEGYCPVTSLTPEGYVDTVDAICDGKVAMALSGSWGIARIMNYYPEYADQIGVVPMVGETDNTGTSCNGGWTYVLSAKSDAETQEKAMTFLKWYLCRIENSCKYFDAAYYSKSPTRKDVMAYIEENSGNVNPDWIQCVNKVAEEGNMTFGASWSIKVQIGALFEYMINHAKDNKSFETLFQEKIQEVNITIDSITSQAGYVTNPKN